MFNLILFFLFIFIIILSILYITDKSRVPYYNLYISFLKICIQIVCFTFFGQIFGLLSSIFICENNSSIIDESLTCRSGFWFYIDSILSSICLIFILYYSFSSILVFYKPNFIMEENDTLKKTNSIPELVLFANKIIFTITLYSTRYNANYHWIILIILFISTLVNVISLFYYNNYENLILSRLNKCLGLILFWSICCLTLGKILQNFDFNGILHLFCFGLIIIILYFFYNKNKINDFYTIDFKLLNTSQKRLKYIKDLLQLIKNKENCREAFIIFNTLILLGEENCINKNCKIKKYLVLSEKGLESDYILYQYCQQLFELSIKQYPNDIILKTNYIIYLVVQMSKKKLAQKILNTMKNRPFHFQNNFIIYYCRKYIESYSYLSKKNFEEENINIMHSFEYEKIFNIFKNSLSKASCLYYEFWSSLYKSHIQGTEDFYKLNDIGEKLNSLIDEIEKKFEQLHRVKSDDIEVLNLYSGFLKNILNNNNKHNQLKNIIDSLSNVDKIQDKEIDFSNLDLKFLNNSDEYKYIIISAEDENLGVILNLSLNVCQIFGYNKSELIGKQITILLPELFHKQFKRYLIQYTNKVKTKFYDLLSHKQEYYPEFLEVFIHGKNKSKYLIPLYIKFFFAQTEENEYIYVIELTLEDNLTINKRSPAFNLNRLNSISNSKEAQSFAYCCVLTDFNFNIQAFTPNCQELLGLNSNALRSNIDITNFIEQFKEELDKMIVEENANELSKYDKSDINLINYGELLKSHLNSTYKTSYALNHIPPNKKIIFKRYIAENKFSELTFISWKFNDLIQVLMGNQNINSNISLSDRSKVKQKNEHSNNSNIDKSIIFNEKTKERYFLLVIKKVSVNGKQVGYKFFFRREKFKCFEEEPASFIENEDNNYLNLKLHKSNKKTNVTFKSNDDDDNNDISDVINDSEKVIHSCKTEKKGKSSQPSKSINNKKEVGNIEEDLVNGSKKLKESNTIERIGTSPLKKNKNKNILKKRHSRFKSVNDLTKYNSLGNNENKFNIDENFIPDSSFNFIIDLETKSYRPSHQINKSNNITNILKTEAYIKVKYYDILKNKKENIEFSYASSDEEEESESYEDSENSSLDSSDNIKKKETKKKHPENNKEKEINGNKNKSLNIKEEFEGHYYKVSGLNKIKLMMYDFDQEMVVDKGIKKDNKSEIDNIIMNYKLKIPTALDKDSNDPSLKIVNILRKYSNKELKKEETDYRDSISGTANILSINPQKRNSKEKEIYKKIENALNKNDREKIITRFFIFIIITTIVLFGISIYILYYIISNLNTIKKNLLLIIYSANIRHDINMGIYYVREMTLLSLNISNKIYYNYPTNKNRSSYLENVKENLKQTFFDGHNNMELIMGLNIEISKNNSFYLYSKPVKTQLLYDENKKRTVTSSLLVSIVQIYSYFYNLVISENIEHKNQEVHNFLYNSLNSVALGLENSVNIFKSEISIRRKKIIMLLGIDSVIIFIVYVIIYIVIYLNFLGIIYKKESYISVFYGINLNFIKTSMIKCEKYIERINPNELLIAQEKNNDNNDDSDSFYNFDNDLVIMKESNKNIEENNKINNKNGKKMKHKEVQQVRIFKIKIIIFLVFCYVYLFVVLLNFILVLNKIEIMGDYIYHQQHFHNNFLNLVNAYREFIFSNDSYMYNLPIYEYVIKAEKEIHLTMSQDITFIEGNCVSIDGLCELFSKLQKNHLCIYNDNNINKCDNYLQIITSLGFYNFISYWLEEIRFKRNYVSLIENFNLTINFWKDDENKILDLYNYQEIHSEVNFLFNHIILSSIEEERNITLYNIIENVSSNKRIYVILLIIYFLLILVFFMLYWRPIINNITALIYKTKNILTIIPVEILANQTNIKSLLDISDLNE